MIRGHIDIESNLDSLIETSPSHNGERFSGWRPEYEISEYPWVPEALDRIAARHDLGKRREQGTWINVLKGVGAEIEEHDEGRADDDITIVLFLSEADGGKLVLEGQEIEPAPGDYVVFDSKTKHRVTPLESDQPRVSAAAILKRS